MFLLINFISIWNEATWFQKIFELLNGSPLVVEIFVIKQKLSISRKSDEIDYFSFKYVDLLP